MGHYARLMSFPLIIEKHTDMQLSFSCIWRRLLVYPPLYPLGLDGFRGHGGLCKLIFYQCASSDRCMAHIDMRRLTLPDLTPNPGLWWYFFTEMFDHFRPFFLMVFSVGFIYIFLISTDMW